MRPIVLATDGSAGAEPAVQRAIELATETHAPLLVFVQSAHCPVIVAPAFETEAKPDPRALLEV